MSAASDYMERLLLDVIFGTLPADWDRPAAFDTLYFGLFTAAPSDSGGGTEVSGNAYARVGVTNNTTNFAAAATSTGTTTKKNATTIQFPQATPSGWGTVTHWGIFDAASAGNLLFWGALTASRAVVNGDAPRFIADAFSIECQ